MNALLRVRLLRKPVRKFQPMPKVGQKTTDAVALGVRVSIARWHLAGCVNCLEGRYAQ